jgi:hypothetical protein
VIEDLDGTTTEPSRRWHVAVLSAATAVVSVVLFYVLVAPPIFDGAPPQAASPSPARSFAMTVVSNPRINLPIDTLHSRMCVDGTSWAPLQLAVDANSRPLLTVLYDRTGSRPIAFVREERGTGRLVVTCATPDGLVPRIDRAR